MVVVACIFVLLVLSGSLGETNFLHPSPSPSVSPSPTPHGGGGGSTPTPNPTATPTPTPIHTPSPSPTSTPTLTPTPAPVTSGLTWLHTVGKALKNDQGQTVILHGAAFGGLGESGLTYWNGGKSNLERMMQQYVFLSGGKANVIRACTSNVFGWGHPEVFDAALDDLVSLAGQNHIYVVVEFHGVAWGSLEVQRLKSNPADWINWFLHFVNRYKSNPVVAGFEIWNEPSSSDFTQVQWRNIAAQCYNAIHTANPRALVIVASVPFGSVSQDWVNHPLGSQAVYGWDNYEKDWSTYWTDPYVAGDASGGRAMTQYFLDTYVFGNASRANLPTWGTEFGWYMTEPAWSQNMNDYLAYLGVQAVNYYVFWWWSNPSNLGLAASNYNGLSPQGQIWAANL